MEKICQEVHLKYSPIGVNGVNKSGQKGAFSRGKTSGNKNRCSIFPGINGDRILSVKGDHNKDKPFRNKISLNHFFNALQDDSIGAAQKTVM
jgi:hypothetical protein